MDISTAKNLIEFTFQNEFDMENFKQFLSELFNISNLYEKNITNFVKFEFMEYIVSFIEIGKFVDAFKEEIGLYVVELKNSSHRDRARTMQRNVVANVIKNQNKTKALVAFYEPNTEDWRFSYVKIDYVFKEGRIDEELSSAKRHSFLVGPNEPNHTCQQQFLNLLINEGNISLSQIDDCFNIEKVSYEFFKNYRELFFDLIDSLEEVLEKDEKVRNEFEYKHIKSSDFAKKLMGQLVFVYFLQKKGWLGVKEKKDLGNGPKNFLRRLFDKEYKDYANFFNDMIEPLFYDGFSYPSKDNHFSQFEFIVPFFNGGLFEPINHYDWENTDILLKDNIFKDILDTFDKFNFTVKEDEPLDKEVAVDPEMLGKVFENLLEVTDRRSKGAYYTPREVVHYMCQQSLISYLSENSDINKEDFILLVKKSDLFIDSIIRCNERKKKYKRECVPRNFPISIIENIDSIKNLLNNVKVADPAVGSGAFPVAMMNEIVKLKHLLLLLEDNPFIDVYELKKETIENSLYAIDIEYSAIEITKLRFWLSLIVDSDTIEPLPNLNYKIICGNSLVDEFEGYKLFDKNLMNFYNSEAEKDDEGTIQSGLYANTLNHKFNKLKEEKIKFFREKEIDKKIEIKEGIEDLVWSIYEESLKEHVSKDEFESLSKELKSFKYLESKPALSWDLEFCEVFNDNNPGFDIIIGNPPYVSWSEIEDRKVLEKGRYLDLRYKCRPNHKDAQPNLYLFFIVKSLSYVNKRGSVSFIIPQEWLSVVQDFRDYFLDKTGNIFIFKFDPSYKVFKNDYEEIGTNSLIMLFENKNNNDKLFLSEFNELNEKKVNSFLDNYSFYELFFNDDCDEIVNLKKKSVKKENIRGDRWNFYHNIVEKILSKNDGNYVLWNDKSSLEVFGGFQPNVELSKKFIIKASDLNFLNDYEKQYIFPCIYKASDIKTYFLNEIKDYWIVVNGLFNNEDDFKNGCPYFYEILSELLDTDKKKWWEFPNTRNLDKYRDFTEKLLSPRTSSKNSFAYDSKRHVIKGTNSAIISKRLPIKYILGILNSKLATFFYKEYGFSYHGTSMKFEPANIKDYMIPIIITDKSLEERVIQLVDKILSSENDELNYNNYVNELDQLVYELYDLTDEEISIIENAI